MREKILISACLVGENCRYDGGNCLREAISTLLEDAEPIVLCPEVVGGLPTPRPPAEQQRDGSIRNIKGLDVTSSYRQGAQKVLAIALEAGVTKAYLKSKSPMCGKGRIYDGSFSGNLIDGNGVLVKLLEKNGIEVILVD